MLTNKQGDQELIYPPFPCIDWKARPIITGIIQSRGISKQHQRYWCIPNEGRKRFCLSLESNGMDGSKSKNRNLVPHQSDWEK